MGRRKPWWQLVWLGALAACQGPRLVSPTDHPATTNPPAQTSMGFGVLPDSLPGHDDQH